MNELEVIMALLAIFFFVARIAYKSGIYILPWETAVNHYYVLPPSREHRKRQREADRRIERKNAEELRAKRLSAMEWGPVIVSVIVLASGLFVILSNTYEESTEKWAYGVVGTVMGYWFSQKPKE